VKSVDQSIGNDLRTKEHEVEELLAALETANLQLEKQQNVNTAIMRKKEEVQCSILSLQNTTGLLLKGLK
jgi:hypothetical protein